MSTRTRRTSSTSSNDLPEEPPEWFTELPNWMRTLLIGSGKFPESWAQYQNPYEPEWSELGSFALGLGWLSPVGLAPFYATGMFRTAVRAGWLEGFAPEEYTYAYREQAAAEQALSYLTPTISRITRESSYQNAIMQANLWGGRAAYWQNQQQLAPLTEVWGATRMAT